MISGFSNGLAFYSSSVFLNVQDKICLYSSIICLGKRWFEPAGLTKNFEFSNLIE